MRISRCCYAITILLFMFLLSSTQAQSQIFKQLTSSINYLVAKDGSGKYTSVQAAINAVPDNNPTPKVIFVKSGVYKEKVEIPQSKPNIILVGEDVNNTVITFNDYSGSGKIYNGIITNAVGKPIGTSSSHTLYVAANDFTMMNITIKNAAGDVGQAVAFNGKGDKHFLYHCKLIGFQDTYYTWKADGKSYIKDCFIEGAVDYIFGSGAAFFESCVLNTVCTKGVITAASSSQKGYVFNNCKLTASSGASSIYLGRPWKPNAKTVFTKCSMGAFISSQGWLVWEGEANHTSSFYGEFDNCGTGAGTLGRVAWSRKLSAANAAGFTLNNILSGWRPATELGVVFKVIQSNTGRFVSSACSGSANSRVSGNNNTEISTIFPNPANNEFFININSLNNSEETISIKIVNLMGVTVFQQNSSAKNGANSYSIPSKGLSNGMYIITIAKQNGEQINAQKIQIQH